MKLEDQVVSLELAKKLKELGVKQDSLWFWTWAEWNKEVEWVLILEDKRAGLKKETFSAFTVAELGEMLPEGYRSYYYNGHPSGGNWMCNDGEILGVADANTEADARAKMLIYLIKEGIIKAEELK